MSEHSWSQEAIETYLAGGLEPAERERLQRHVAECAECARAVDEARVNDQRLEALFVPVRPDGGLEERMIRELRAAPARRGFRPLPRWGKIVAGVAAMLILAAGGAGVMAVMEEGLLQTPARVLLLQDVSGSMGTMDDFAEGQLIFDADRSMIGLDARIDTFMEHAKKSMNLARLESSERPLGDDWGGHVPGKININSLAEGMAADIRNENSIESYPPALALITKAPSRVHTSITGGLIAGRRQPNVDGTSSGSMAKSASEATIANQLKQFDSKWATQMNWSAFVEPDNDGHWGYRSYGKKIEHRELRDSPKKMGAGVQDPLVTTDVDPKAVQPSQKMFVSGLTAKPDSQIANQGGNGRVNPLESVGIQDADTSKAPTNLPAPAGIGQGGAITGRPLAGSFWGRSDKTRESALKASSYFKPGDTFLRKRIDPKDLYNLTEAPGEKLRKDEPEKKKEPEVKKSDPKKPDAKKNEPAKDPVVPQPANRKIIRSGEIDFEVESFDDSVAIILKLVEGKGGFVATVNSDKLANGKMRGSVVIRVPPEKLDKLVEALREHLKGELKGQRIGSQDVTKQYTDMESRLRAARTMEDRLLKIIKDGKGEIKDLVAAEKELGVWRTRIEELEGELRYYGNLVSLSTLTVNLSEKEIRTAAAVAERERVQAGIEVEDVEKAYQDALKTIAELKGRVTKSELKQHAAGQFNAILHFEVAPESAGLMRDRLRQLGTMARMEIDRVQQAEGPGKMPLDGKVHRGDTQFMVSIYNLANVQPRETVTIMLAATDVPKAFADLREAVAKAKGRVINSNLSEKDRQNISAALEFDIRRTGDGAIQTALNEAGELLSRQANRVPEGDNVSDAKVHYKLDIMPASTIPPRETTKLGLEVADVALTLKAFSETVKESKGRVVVPPRIAQEKSGRGTALVVYDVPLSAGPGVIEEFKKTGQVRVHDVTPNPQAPEGKLALARIEVVMSNELLVPRDEGLWSQIRNGISFSLRGLSLSASWLIVGVLFVLPWVVLLWVIVWVGRRVFRRREPRTQ